MKKRNFLAMLLSICCAFLAFTACRESSQSADPPTPTFSINVSSVKLSSVIGEYEVPSYFVVDENGLVQAGYEVTVASVTDPDGANVTVRNGVFTATKAGTYKVTYTAGEGVENAVLEIEFTKPAPMTFAAFDKMKPAMKIYKDVVTAAYDSTQKYEGEEGSLKLTRAKTGEGYVTLTSPNVQDLTPYDYMVFRVYNPTALDVQFGICWFADTVCKAGKWTEIKIDLDAAWGAESTLDGTGVIDSIYTGKDIPRSSVTEFALRLISGLQIGESIYVSAVYVMCE